MSSSPFLSTAPEIPSETSSKILVTNTVEISLSSTHLPPPPPPPMPSRSLSWRRRVHPSIEGPSTVLHPLDPSIVALVSSLLNASKELKSCKKPRICHRRNSIMLCRRAALLSDLFQEIKTSGIWIAPSAMASFRSLRSTFHTIKALLHNCRHTSNLLLLMEQDLISAQFHSLTGSIAAALSSLPYDLLEISDDVKEQVAMVQAQSSRFEAYIDPEEWKLRIEVLDIMSDFEMQVSPRSEKLKGIFEKLRFNNAVDCERELSLLEKEKEKLKADALLAEIPNINSLISFVRYARCVLYGLGPEQEVAAACRKYDLLACKSMKKMVFEVKPIGEETLPGDLAYVPDDFRCPISLELMVDPVVIASGQSYERHSIVRWFEDGHTTCPKTGSDLTCTDIIPNSSLRRLITQWCSENDYVLESRDKTSAAGSKECSDGQHLKTLQVDRLPNTKATMEATKLTAEFLVQKLRKSGGHVEVQRQAAYELRLMAKEGMDNRICVAAAGAIPVLVKLMASSADKATQENVVTALLNLSLNEKNKEEIMAEEGAVDGLVSVLRDSRGASDAARENAAAALFSLTTLKGNREAIGSKKGAIDGLLELMRTGRSRGKKDATLALLNIGLGNGHQAMSLLKKGTVLTVLEILESEHNGDDRELSAELVALLGVLARRPEGLVAIISGLARVVPQLVQILVNGSDDAKERTAALLLVACASSDDLVPLCPHLSSGSLSADLRRRLLGSPLLLPALKRLVVGGKPRAQRKATSLLKVLQRRSPPPPPSSPSP